MVVNCKCPGCGAVMEYDGESGRLYCDSCKTEMTVEEYRAQYDEENESKAMEESQDAAGKEPPLEKSAEPSQEQVIQIESEEFLQEEADEEEIMQVQTYHCPSCGAELMTGEHTAVAVCTFCGNPGLIADRLSGERQPRAILPFQMNKEQVVEYFLNWIKKKPLAPRELRSRSVIEKITGIYVPYWLYDYHTSAIVQANATRVRKHREGDVEYTYTDYYDIYRNMDMDFEKIPVDASGHMDDTVMESLEPYDYSKMKPFDIAYLSGYQAEKYNFTSEDLRKRAEERITETALEEARKTIDDSYKTLEMAEQTVKVRQKKVNYVMLPVWVLNYRHKNKSYVFMLNGQSGKINCKLPMSAVSVVKRYGFVSGLIFLVMMAISLYKGLFG